MTRRQISAAIQKALLGGKYAATFTKKSGCFRILFDYYDNEEDSYPKRTCGILMMFPDQVKDDTIVVSTDVIRLPQEVDPDDIWERIVEMNAHDKITGVRYEVPFLYHASSGINRALLVIKEFQAISEDNVIKSLPIVIEDVLNATGKFKEQFFHGN